MFFLLKIKSIKLEKYQNFLSEVNLDLDLLVDNIARLFI